MSEHVRVRIVVDDRFSPKLRKAIINVWALKLRINTSEFMRRYRP